MADKIEKKNISISNINCKTGLNCDRFDTFLKELYGTEFQNGIIQEPFKDKIIDFNKKQIKSVNIKLKKDNKLEKTTIRFRLNEEFRKLTGLLTYKALDKIFQNFCDELKNRGIFTNYFKVISIHFRREKKQGYVFLLTVLSETNKSKTQFRTSSNNNNNNNNQDLVSKCKLQEYFDSKFYKLVIKNKDHFVRQIFNFDNEKNDLFYNNVLMNGYIDNIYSYSKYILNKYKIKKYPYTYPFQILRYNNEYIILYCRNIENDECKNIFINDIIIYNKKKEYLNKYKIELNTLVKNADIYNNAFLKSYRMPYKPLKCWFYIENSMYFVEDINDDVISELNKNSSENDTKYIELYYMGNNKYNEYIDNDTVYEVTNQKYDCKYSEIDFISFCNLYKINECQVCFENFYRKKILKNKNKSQNCHHKICPSCLNHFVISKLEEYKSLNKPPNYIVQCPITDCDKKLILFKNHTLTIINRYHKFLSQNTIKELKELANDIFNISENDDSSNYMTRETAEKELETILFEDKDKSLHGKLNICPNNKCNTIIHKTNGCMAVICTECGTKLCIVCGEFDILKGVCNCKKKAITSVYFEERQEVKDENMIRLC